MALRDSAIIAYAETKFVPRESRDVWELGAEMLEAIIDRSGFEKREIDGFIATCGMTSAGTIFWPQSTADQLGLELDYCDTVTLGGCSPTAAVARATAVIDAGLCSTVLVLFADTPMSEGHLRMRGFESQFTEPHGVIAPPWSFGLLSSSYHEQYGIDLEALGKLAVTQRNHAILNDNACEKLRKPITVQDYLDSPMIADPIRLLDCVMPCDGAAALLITSREHARRRGCPAIVPIGYGERTNFEIATPQPDPTRSGHVVAGARALAQAGLGLPDMGSFHPYDDFIIAIPLQMEALGYCGPGQSMAFIRDHDFQFDGGGIPLNTGGGQISAGQAANASVNLIEAVRQLLGEGGARQVPSGETALVTGIGWINYARNWGSSTALVLRREA